MITTKQELREAISLDRKRYGYSIKSYIKGLILKSDASHAIRLLTILRKTEYYFNNKNRNIFCRLMYVLYYVKYRRIQYKYDTYIAINCCKPGLWIPHMGGQIINCKSMGYNCSVNKGVVIGNKKGQENRAIIGDNCYFTLGSK